MTKYHYCLLLMGSLLLGSCQSVEQLSIDYMLPAEVSFPATLKRVAVVRKNRKKARMRWHASPTTTMETPQ